MQQASVAMDYNTYPTPFFSSGTASSLAEFIPRFTTNDWPKTTCDRILRQRSALGMDQFPRGGDAARQTAQLPALPPILQQRPRLISPSQMRANTDNEESELEYNGPEILESLRETLLAPRTPIEPVINAAKSVVDLLPDFMNTKTERGSHLANEDQVV